MNAPSSSPRHDYVVLGGGTAGCVLAARLSERASDRVLLIEAGMDTPPGSVPADILDVYPLSYANPAYRWALKGHARLASDSPERPLYHARVMGGGSSIMGMIMLRGTPTDYDGWADAGAAGWAWEDVLPWFRSLENDLDFDGPMHGSSGPTEIRRHDPARWPPVPKAVAEHLGSRGVPFVADMNADFRDGLGSLPIAGTTRRRATAATAYLTPEVRSRPNLEIVSGSTAEALLWEDGRVVGARVATPAGPREFRAREVIVSMGALLTPHFLLGQGIGDPDSLRDWGIAVRAPLRGVGRNLQNHAALTLAMHIKRAGVQRRPERNHNNAMLRFSSGEPGCGPCDMALGIGSRASWHSIAARVAHLSPIVMAPASRGRVSLRPSGTTDAPPLVEYNLLGDARDERRLSASVGLVAELADMLQSRSLVGRPVPMSRVANAARFAQRTVSNRIATAVLGFVMDAAPRVGEAMVGALGEQGMSWNDLVADPAARDAFVRSNLTPLAHHAGTCRMGSAEDRDAVVDSSGRVHGVPGLRVADASIMPTVPRGNTNLPVLMVAEKLADAIRRASA
ncbi:GMC oxidoreductase [Sphingomonas corticis]|uniref:Uncharacterized protein n=1 Tax=Sphingomonas corticis TaxID=2722791 RepID=A0ABX1CRR8_9SPHN|nr:hypothetical protein [Sphingomonas corticis]